MGHYAYAVFQGLSVNLSLTPGYAHSDFMQ